MDFLSIILENKIQIPLLVIYKNPLDYPGQYVVRLWDMDKPTFFAHVCDTHQEALRVIPGHMMRLEPEKNDDPAILEIWL